MRCCLCVMDVLFMSSRALKSTVNKWLNTGNQSQREWLCRIRASRCSVHYCGLYKGLINQLIAPHRMVSPSSLQTVDARKSFLKRKWRGYTSASQCSIWLGGFHKTLNLGNRPVALYLQCTVWSHVTKKCANGNHKVHWLLCLMCHFHFLRCKK